MLISPEDGEAVAYALWKLQERGRMFVSPGDKLYEGMIIGIHSRDNDLVVNPIKGKQLTNVRASGTDEAVRLVPPIQLTLEYAVEFIADDELVEVTPTVDPHPQALPQGARAEEGEPRSGVTRRRPKPAAHESGPEHLESLGDELHAHRHQHAGRKMRVAMPTPLLPRRRASGSAAPRQTQVMMPMARADAHERAQLPSVRARGSR